MNSTTTLRRYSKEKPTHFVADGSPLGIQATIYQEEAKDRWVPIDHVSRALTPTEQKYAPIERESLAQSWEMTQFRYYLLFFIYIHTDLNWTLFYFNNTAIHLLGKPFTCWTDHQPLIPLYNNRQKTASLHISNHRDKIQDLSLKMQYLPGKEMPCDYGRRHSIPIDHLSEEEQNRLGFDNGQEIIVRKIDITHSPDALKTEGIKEAANRDVDYQYLINAITKGRKDKHTAKMGYNRVWEELCIVDDLVYKGKKLVLPNSHSDNCATNIQTLTLDIAHEGHQGPGAVKQFLRSVSGFHRWTSSSTNEQKSAILVKPQQR